MRHWHDTGWTTGHWVFMSLLMVAFWALVIIAIVWMVRSARHHSSHAPAWLTPLPVPPGQIPPGQVPPTGPLAAQSIDPALAILNERFARGEIDETEYRQRREVLGGG